MTCFKLKKRYFYIPVTPLFFTIGEIFDIHYQLQRPLHQHLHFNQIFKGTSHHILFYFIITLLYNCVNQIRTGVETIDSNNKQSLPLLKCGCISVHTRETSRKRIKIILVPLMSFCHFPAV